MARPANLFHPSGDRRPALNVRPAAERGAVITVVGPTAAGKSGLSLRLAQVLDGEIVNADSMQLYRGMDIGTAKLPPDQRGDVPHHLLDIWDVTRTANVSEYQRLAREAIEDIHARGRLPIVVGGSGLYVRAVIDNLDFPGTEPELRSRLERELAELGPAALHARLARLDPVAAGSILPGNGRRVVRALEVLELSGRPFSATLPSYESVYDVVQVGVRVPRPQLDERITSRIAAMWQAGFVTEVRGLAAAGLREGKTASRALGYAQVLRFLAGEWSNEETVAQTVKATRRFARRQESWFRRDPRITWLMADEADADQEDLAARAVATIRACGLPRATERGTTS
jgi:tRNA dimethylallyltransferase